MGFTFKAISNAVLSILSAEFFWKCINVTVATIRGTITKSKTFRHFQEP